tara:strand:+ start:10472 stop:11161 length:690 start_codon:yes stop_codon:yes gene_type:complete
METEATLIEKKDLTHDTKLFFLQLDNSLSFSPGQFVMVNVDKSDKTLSRAFSIASLPNDENIIELCIKILPHGTVSLLFDSLPLQSRLSVKGPLGPFSVRSKEKELVFIAAGTGIAPIRSMLFSLAKENSKTPISLFYRFKSDADKLFYGELEALKQKLPQLKIIYSVSNPSPAWSGESVRIHECIKKYINNPENKDVYICGPPMMVQDTIPALVELGFNTNTIYKEAW